MTDSLTIQQCIAIALTQGATHDVITKNMSVQSMCERTVELFEGMLAEVRRKYPEGSTV